MCRLEMLCMSGYISIETKGYFRYTVRMKTEKKRSDDTPKLISSLKHAISHYITDELTKGGMIHLAPSHGEIISILVRHDGQMTKSEIARKIHKDKSTVTSLVRKLERMGYVRVEQCPEDTRKNFVVPTNQAREYTDYVSQISEGMYEQLFQGISSEDREYFRVLLKQMIANFETSNCVIDNEELQT